MPTRARQGRPGSCPGCASRWGRCILLPHGRSMTMFVLLVGYAYPQLGVQGKIGKPIFPEGARCRLVPWAPAPEPAAPWAVQVALTGESGRSPLSERAPLRSLGPVLCTGRVFSHRIDLLPGGCSCWCWVHRASSIARPRRLQTSMPFGQWSAASHRALLARWHRGSS